MLLENKQYQTYVEALENIKMLLYKDYNVVLDVKMVMLDFELAMQQALRTVLAENVIIKGCWFHFCQAILRKIGQLGLKEEYNNNFNFRFWVKQFMALALIPLSKLEEAINIIKTTI